MKKCPTCGGLTASNGPDQCPACLRDERPGLSGVIRPHEAPPAKAERPAKEPHRTAPIGFTAEPPKPSGLPRRNPKVAPTESAQPANAESPSGPPGRIGEVDQAGSESLSRPITFKVTESLYDRLVALAQSRHTSVPDLLREAVGDLLEANGA
ncbi:MAG: ribbon-helix-helix protein, CopG family [Parcubacteria group bacterium]|jgi:hypothetical protein